MANKNVSIMDYAAFIMLLLLIVLMCWVMGYLLENPSCRKPECLAVMDNQTVIHLGVYGDCNKLAKNVIYVKAESIQENGGLLWNLTK